MCLVESPTPITLNYPQERLLVRWWVNGKPASAKVRDELEKMLDRGEKVIMGKKLLVDLEIDPGQLNAKPGDKLELQVMYCKHGWATVGSDIKRIHGLVPSDESEILLSNRLQLEPVDRGDDNGPIVRGRVVDDAGKPLAGTNLYIATWFESGGQASARRVLQTVVSDKNGEYQFKPLSTQKFLTPKNANQITRLIYSRDGYVCSGEKYREVKSPTEPGPDQIFKLTMTRAKAKRDDNFTWSGEGDNKQLVIFEATDEMLATIAERQDIVELQLYADRSSGYNGPANQVPPSGVTDDGLRHLAGLTNLRVLALPERGITDAGLVHLKDLDNLQELWLDFLPLTDESTTHLRDLTGLKVLRFYQASITDKGMQNFRDMLELEDLQLGESLITDRSMSLIGNMKKLKTLDLRTKITDEGTVHLAGLSELTWLALSGSAVTDRSLEHIGKLAKLEWLLLGNTVVGDAGIEHLRNHKSITTLYLSSTPVTDQCLDTLATIKTLEHLKLNDTQITDEGLKKLHEHPGLRTIELNKTAVTSHAVKALRAANPRLEVTMK